MYSWVQETSVHPNQIWQVDLSEISYRWPKLYGTFQSSDVIDLRHGYRGIQ